MEIKAFLISCLSVGQACKLFGISKNKFNLETRFVIREDCFCIQVLIGRKQEGIIFLIFDLLIDQDDDFDIAFEALMIQHQAIQGNPILRVMVGEARYVLLDNFSIVSLLVATAFLTLGACVKITHVGIASQFADLVQLEVGDAINEFLLAKIAIHTQIGFIGFEARVDLSKVR